MTPPLKWMAAIRDHPERPPAMQYHVLTMLALRLSWSAKPGRPVGAGFASTSQLMADAEVSESTARRALLWARGTPRDEQFFLACTRRGHRLGNGSVAASEWLLRLPSQPVTRDMLTPVSTGQGDDLNRSMDPSQPVTGDAPSRPVPPRDSHHRGRVPRAPKGERGAARARRPSPAASPAAPLRPPEITIPSANRSGPGAPAYPIPADGRAPEGEQAERADSDSPEVQALLAVVRRDLARQAAP